MAVACDRWSPTFPLGRSGTRRGGLGGASQFTLGVGASSGGDNRDPIANGVTTCGASGLVATSPVRQLASVP